MKYLPERLSCRKALGASLFARMAECGFDRVDVPGTWEAVFAREIPGKGIRVMVYSSCNPTSTGGTARKCGTDAIRVSAVYTNKKGFDRGIVKSSRVYRTGEVDAIVDRTYSRMREVWKKASTTSCCKSCGSPLFTSKKGNLVCADVCWA